MKRSPVTGPRRAPKAAKAAPGDDAAAAAARALAASAGGGALGARAAAALFDAAAGPCTVGGCRRARDAPACLCRLAPAPGAHREPGLWARTPAALAGLGDDLSALHEARALVRVHAATLRRSLRARRTPADARALAPARRSPKHLRRRRASRRGCATWVRRATSTPCCSASSPTRPSARACTPRSRRRWRSSRR